MSLLSQREVLKLKLSSIPVSQLRELALTMSISDTGLGADLIKGLLVHSIDERVVNRFIKRKFAEGVERRRAVISDDDLRKELMRVKDFHWGVVQGQLDQKIQAEYVRKLVRYDDLLKSVKARLHDDVTSYVICTWFNHWTTVLIEEHISIHPEVIPTLKQIKGVDIFFDGQPFDLKVTYLPKNYNVDDAIRTPKDLAVWMYENQGAQRFGADNRLFVVLFDKNNPDRSWELKRDFNLVFRKIDAFFHQEAVSKIDELVFTYNKTAYSAVSKVLIITN